MCVLYMKGVKGNRIFAVGIMEDDIYIRTFLMAHGLSSRPETLLTGQLAVFYTQLIAHNTAPFVVGHSRYALLN